MSMDIHLKSRRAALASLKSSHKYEITAGVFGIAAVLLGIAAAFTWLTLSRRAYNKSRPDAVQSVLIPFFRFLDAHRIWKKDVGYSAEYNFGTHSALINAIELEDEIGANGSLPNLVTNPLSTTRSQMSTVSSTAELFARIVTSISTRCVSSRDSELIGEVLRSIYNVLSMHPDVQAESAAAFLKTLKQIPFITYDEHKDWYSVSESKIKIVDTPLSMVLSTDHRSLMTGPIHGAAGGTHGDYISAGSLFCTIKAATEILIDSKNLAIRPLVNIYSIAAELTSTYESLMHDVGMKYICAHALLAHEVCDNYKSFFPDVTTTHDPSDDVSGPSRQVDALNKVRTLADCLDDMLDMRASRNPSVSVHDYINMIITRYNTLSNDNCATPWVLALSQSKDASAQDQMVAI